MNPNDFLIEQVLWLGLYLGACFFLICGVWVAFAILFTRLETQIQQIREEYLIPTGGINSDVEREKGKLVVQGKDVGDE